MNKPTIAHTKRAFLAASLLAACAVTSLAQAQQVFRVTAIPEGFHVILSRTPHSFP